MMTTAAYMAAIGLAGVAGYFSICGMLVLFPGLTVLDRMAGARAAIVVMAIAMEIAKLVTVGFLARHWRRIDRLWRIVLLVLVAGLEVINAAGVYSQLVAAHFSHRVATISSVEIQTATTGAMIEVQSNTIADIDRRLNQIDAAVEEATKRGKTNGAIEMIGTQRKARADLMAERRHEADILTKLKIDQAEIAAKARAVEVENAPIRYVAELIGGTTEEAIRMLILMMVLCCDPLAIALTAAAAARSKEGIA
jgi:hypothetical protein